jgi:hypothetical protein
MAVSKADFIDDAAILAALQNGSRRVSTSDTEAIIQKAALGEGLSARRRQGTARRNIQNGNCH